jgi:hypothetical protein
MTYILVNNTEMVLRAVLDIANRPMVDGDGERAIDFGGPFQLDECLVGPLWPARSPGPVAKLLEETP